MALSHAIQDHFVQRRSPYPLERTLLTTGLTDAVMRGRRRQPLETPHLDIAYAPRDSRAMREMGHRLGGPVLESQPERRGVGMLAEM